MREITMISIIPRNMLFSVLELNYGSRASGKEPKINRTAARELRIRRIIELISGIKFWRRKSSRDGYSSRRPTCFRALSANANFTLFLRIHSMTQFPIHSQSSRHEDLFIFPVLFLFGGFFPISAHPKKAKSEKRRSFSAGRARGDAALVSRALDSGPRIRMGKKCVN